MKTYKFNFILFLIQNKSEKKKISRMRLFNRQQKDHIFSVRQKQIFVNLPFERLKKGQEPVKASNWNLRAGIYMISTQNNSNHFLLSSSYFWLLVDWLACCIKWTAKKKKNNLMKIVQFIFSSLHSLTYFFFYTYINIWLESLWRLISALNDWFLISFASGFLISFNCFQFYYHYFCCCFYCYDQLILHGWWFFH